MKKLPKTIAILLAAGRGSRMGDEESGPKQYRLIGDKSVLRRTQEAFLACDQIDRILVVIHPEDHALYEASSAVHEKILPPVDGGATRQESGYLGLQALEDSHQPDIVLIHDAARPFIDPDTILRVINAVEKNGCVLPAIGVSDTVKLANESDGSRVVTDTIDRNTVFLAQTPQGFDYPAIWTAHQKAAQEPREFTDDCAIAEWAGLTVQLVDGNAANIKITTKQDLNKANKMSEIESELKLPDIRTGIGYDVHRLVPGDGVILGGVKVPFEQKLDGHSDADVALHAITDALLGCIGDGDIGSHFPPSDPVWAGAASDQFLAHACTQVRQHGGTITHLDVTIVCEAPKIGPYREAMRKSISKICGLDLKRVSVKATTHERIGTLGRGEGIAAIATATVVISQ